MVRFHRDLQLGWVEGLNARRRTPWARRSGTEFVKAIERARRKEFLYLAVLGSLLGFFRILFLAQAPQSPQQRSCNYQGDSHTENSNLHLSRRGHKIHPRMYRGFLGILFLAQVPQSPQQRSCNYRWDSRIENSCLHFSPRGHKIHLRMYRCSCRTSHSSHQN